MKKNFCVLIVCMFCICAVAPVNAFAYDLPNGLDRTDEVTFGVYDHTSGALVESDPVELGDYFLNGLSKGLYEAYYTEFTAGGVDEQFLYNYFYNNWQWLRDVAYNGWLLNCVIDINYLYIFGVRIPSSNGHPGFVFSSGTLPDTYTWTVEYDNSSCVFLIDPNDDDIMVGFCPEFNSYENYTVNAVTLQSQWPSSVDYSYLSDTSLRGFFIQLSKPTLFDSNFSLTLPSSVYPIYYSPSSQWQCAKNVQTGAYYSQMFHGLDKVILCTFPFFTTGLLRSVNISAFSQEYWINTDFPPVSVEFSTSSYTNIYLSEYNTVTPDPTLPPGVSPTPPVWITPTPYPTAAIPTPDIPGGSYDWYTPIGDLLYLVTRHYTFSISGYTINISPFYTFMACLIMGLLARAFFGGSHE